MSRFARAVLILLLAALPLRGMAGVAAALCGPQHHAPAAMEMPHHGCEEGAAHAPAQDDSGSPVETACSHCAACSVGSPAVPVVAAVQFPAHAGEPAIPYLHHLQLGYVSERLDRPPLAL
jgi:hypothetical protein